MNAFFRIPYQHPASGSVRRVVSDALYFMVLIRLSIHRSYLHSCPVIGNLDCNKLTIDMAESALTQL
jgi:hypothetical protein